MRKVFALVVVLAFFLNGCVFISVPIPGVEPLTEKTVAGAGADKVLMIDISGTITDEDRSNVLGVQTDVNITARVREELQKAYADPSVKALVLRINTPGGVVTTCDIIREEIRNFKKRKNVPVVAELMDVAASGGYYIASAADTIVAHPTTVTGSIGVIAFNINASGLMEKIGLANQTIKSGDKKDIGSPIRPMTDEDRQILQSVIDGMYERFLDVIIEGRGKLISREELRRVADGRIYTADQALKLKLIDSIGYLEDGIGASMKAAGMSQARIVTYARPGSYKNNIYSSVAPAAAGINIINIEGGLFGRPGLKFMYLWQP